MLRRTFQRLPEKYDLELGNGSLYLLTMNRRKLVLGVWVYIVDVLNLSSVQLHCCYGVHVYAIQKIKMPEYKLTYFNVKGLSEYIRYIFAYANVKFEDNRIARDSWPALKEKQPYGSLPVLEVDGKLLNQSIAILRYLGNQFGLVPSDAFTNALLEALVDNMKDGQQKLKEAITKKTPEALEESKKAQEYLFQRIEPLLADGYFYGSKLTWVDIYFAGICDTISDYQPNFLDNFPKLKAHVEKIQSLDGIKQYIQNRPAYEVHNH